MITFITLTIFLVTIMITVNFDFLCEEHVWYVGRANHILFDFYLMAVFYDKSKFVRCFLRPNSTHIQICSVKYCPNIFQGTKISLEILIASAVCQLGNIFDFAATHKFIFKIQNLWQEHKFKFRAKSA